MIVISVILVLVQSSAVFHNLLCSTTWSHILIIFLHFVYRNFDTVSHRVSPIPTSYYLLTSPLSNIVYCNTIVMFRTHRFVRVVPHHITSFDRVSVCTTSYNLSHITGATSSARTNSQPSSSLCYIIRGLFVGFV
jgi:hypothetical protein